MVKELLMARIITGRVWVRCGTKCIHVISVMPRLVRNCARGGASSTPQLLDSITTVMEYWIARLRGR